MNRFFIAFALSVTAALWTAATTYAYDGYEQYYQEQRQMEEAELDAHQAESDKADYELESKVAVYEEQQAQETQEGDAAALKFFAYIALGVLSLIVITYISHLLDRPRRDKK